MPSQKHNRHHPSHRLKSPDVLRAHTPTMSVVGTLTALKQRSTYANGLRHLFPSELRGPLRLVQVPQLQLLRVQNYRQTTDAARLVPGRRRARSDELMLYIHIYTSARCNTA